MEVYTWVIFHCHVAEVFPCSQPSQAPSRMVTRNLMGQSRALYELVSTLDDEIT